MRNLTLALTAAGCLAFSAPPALATAAMSNTGPSSSVSAKSGLINQKLAQAQYNSTKKKTDEINKQDQTRRRSWGGGGY